MTMLPRRFAERVAIITGGGSGIGLAIAQRLAAEGASVMIVERNGENAAAKAAELVASLYRKVGVTDQTFYRLRVRYCALKEEGAKRLQLFEQENSRLKRIVADQALDISMLKDLQKGKW